MGDFVPDPGDTIADAVVAFLNDPARDFWTQAQALKPINPAAELKKENEPLRVLVYPVEGVFAERRGRGGQLVADRLVRVVVVGPMGQDLSLSEYLGFAYEIERALWGQAMGPAVWSATDLTVFWDPAQLHQAHRFVGVRTITYRYTDGPPA